MNKEQQIEIGSLVTDPFHQYFIVHLPEGISKEEARELRSIHEAAPDMYEALTNALWNFEGKQNLTPVQQKAIEYIKAAINKANGK